MTTETFKCEWCEEEYATTLKFSVKGEINLGNGDPEIVDDWVCPDCIAAQFTETPEYITSLKIERWLEI